MLFHQKHKCLLKSDPWWRHDSFFISSHVSCVSKELVLTFVLTRVTLGRSALGPPQPWQAGRQGGKQDLGTWVEVWTPCRGIRRYAVSKRLRELQPCAGKYPGGRDVGEAERPFLSGGERMTGAGHSFKINPDRQQELSGGMVARNQVRSKSWWPKLSHQTSKGNVTRGSVVGRGTLVLCGSQPPWLGKHRSGRVRGSATHPWQVGHKV